MSMKLKVKLSGIGVVFSIAVFLVSVGNCTVGQQNTEQGFEYIFDGKTLNGWEGDPVYWRVEDSAIIGEVTPETILERNTFIIWQGAKPANFELKLEYRITETGNSGVNYRSVEVDDLPYALRGYQLDIDGRKRYAGQNYEERGRTTLAYPGEKVELQTLADQLQTGRAGFRGEKCMAHRNVQDYAGVIDEMKAQIRSNDWNECHLVVKGNRLLHYINGVLMSDVTDNDVINRKMEGLIGVQVHVGPPMKVEYRNIRIKYLD
jgi:hypothetical protein